MSLRRNVGSQSSNNHYAPLLDLDFCWAKYFHSSIFKAWNWYRRVRKHRIGHVDFMLASYRRVLTMVTTENSLVPLFREKNEKKRVLIKNADDNFFNSLCRKNHHHSSPSCIVHLIVVTTSAFTPSSVCIWLLRSSSGRDRHEFSHPTVVVVCPLGVQSSRCHSCIDVIFTS